MKLIFSLLIILMMPNLFLAWSIFPSQANSLGSIRAPIIKPKYTIDLSGMSGGSWLQKVVFGTWIEKLAFSPDSRYLAIFDGVSTTEGFLIIWDVEKNREQARITGLNASFGSSSESRIFWSPDGKTITLGFSQNTLVQGHIWPYLTFWDPMTGIIVKNPNVQAGFDTRFNHDGTKLVVSSGSLNHTSFRIYDTQTWDFKEYDGAGIQIFYGTICWTKDNNILIVNQWDNAYQGHVLDGLKMADTLARLFDPVKNEVIKTILLVPSVPWPPPSPYFGSPFSCVFNAVDWINNRIAVGGVTYKILDGNTLNVLYTFDPPHSSKDYLKEIEFSPDGKYLYLMNAVEGDGKSKILDANTGHIIGTFPGGRSGFSVSQDGKSLATGNGSTVHIFSIQ